MKKATKIRHNWGAAATLGAVSLSLYFGLSAYTGSYGWKHLQQVNEDYSTLAAVAANTTAERHYYETLNEGLVSSALDPDALEVMARSRLGFVHQDDVVIYLN